MTVKLEHLEELIIKFQCHCNDCISENDLIKTVKVDTKIYHHERDNETLAKIQKLAPFGEGNPEPIFLLENVQIQKVEKVGNKTKTHLKLHTLFGEQKLTAMFRGKGDDVDATMIRGKKPVSIVGKIRKDTYNGGYFIDGADIQ
ncbi:MAG: hypothetical protein WCG98_06885 [bacterium]